MPTESVFIRPIGPHVEQSARDKLDDHRLVATVEIAVNNKMEVVG